MRRFFLFFVLFFSCLPDLHAAPAVFRSANAWDLKSFDPADFYGATILLGIYETLYQYSYLSDPLTLEPVLASAMPKVSDDRLTVTIPLKPGIFFADDPCFKATSGKGRELTADDVVYSLKRLALPSLASGWWAVSGKVVGLDALHDKLATAPKAEWLKMIDEPIDGVRALDSHTLQLKLTQPYPQLSYVLAVMVTAILPHEAVEAYATDGEILDHPVGSGPFILKEWSRNQRIVLDRNPHYHPDFYPSHATGVMNTHDFLADQGKKLPLVDQVVYEMVKEDQPQRLKFFSKVYDEILLAKDDLAELASGRLSKYRLNIGDSVSTAFVAINMKDPLLGKNKALRQALSSAIDRKEWNSLFAGGIAEKMTSALPALALGRPDSQHLKYDHDLKKAKALLAKAGFPNGAGLPALGLDMPNSNTSERQLAEWLIRQWSAIGVHVRMNLNSGPMYLEKRNKGELQIFVDGWTMDYPDPENVYGCLYGPNRAPGSNVVSFENSEFDRLFAKMSIMEPGPKRTAILKQMDDVVQEEVPWIMGLYPKNVRLAQPWLKNFRFSEMLWNRLKYLRPDK